MQRIALLAILLCAAARHGAAQQTELLQINSDRVNLRSAPSVDSAVVKSLNKGAVVTVLSKDGGWTKVQLKGQATTGWIRSNLLSPVPGAAPGANTAPAAPAASRTATPAPPLPPPPSARAVEPAAAAPAQASTASAATPQFHPEGYKDPGTATILSVIVPGGGQIYAGDLSRGLVMLGVPLVLTPIICVGAAENGSAAPCGLMLLADLGVWIYGIVDAAPTARRKNAEHGIRVGLTPLVLPATHPRFGLALAVHF